MRKESLVDNGSGRSGYLHGVLKSLYKLFVSYLEKKNRNYKVEKCEDTLTSDLKYH